jgi:hypothetical protein
MEAHGFKGFSMPWKILRLPLKKRKIGCPKVSKGPKKGEKEKKRGFCGGFLH